MEIGSPVICADTVNMSFPEIDSLQSDPRIMIRNLDSLAVRANNGHGEFTMAPSGGEGDAFNSVVERDRLDKELASLALLKGARLQIRAEMTGFEETDGSVLSTYRKGGKEFSVKSTALVLATGMGPCDGQQASGCFNYSYGRRIGRSKMKSEIAFGPKGSVSFSMSRSGEEHNSLISSPDCGDGQKVENRGEDLILKGSIFRAIPDHFDPGRGNIIHVGSFSGLYDPFFRTGFREAFISGRYAAESILESSAENASVNYGKKVEANMADGMEYGRKLGKKLSMASGEKITQFFNYLSGFEYMEISAREIIKRTGLKDSELEEML